MDRIIGINRARLILLTAIMLLMPAVLIAQERSEDKSVEYTIQKGDTLWTISSGKLKDPFLWPKLWEANPRVHNPHLIYPDQNIIIPAELLKGAIRKGGTSVSAKGRSDAKRKLVPVKVMTPKYLPVGPKKPIVPKEVLLESGYFVRNFTAAGSVATADPERTLFGSNDSIYISSPTKLIPDTKYYIGQKPEKIVDPVEDKEIAGYLVRIKGVLQITGEENGKIKAIITDNYKEIMSGDVIFDYYPVSLPYGPLIERRPPVSGIIVGIGFNRQPGGKDDVVYINRGLSHGIETGDIFTISSGKKPNPVIGTFQVFSVFEETAIGVITKAKSDVRPGDTFGN